MIRRIVGIAHVADLETITDQNIRSSCEKRVLVLARQLMIYSISYIPLGQGSLDTPSQVVTLAREFYSTPEPATWPSS